MSFQLDKSQLENAFAVLNNQASQTNEEWKDSVQERFYDQFINSLPKEFFSYIQELNKLDQIFENTEQMISELQQ
jgi:hypothetical protein